MRIATLQFSPCLGDVEGNIKRADELLRNAQQLHGDAMRNLDLLVLPEMVFSGYNFSSLNTIKPYLEPTEAGPSSDWARSTARRLGCAVSVGYPEIKTTVQESKTEAGHGGDDQKRFNSVLIVDSLGNTLKNYQKRFLYYTDEPWALEGENGPGNFSLKISPRPEKEGNPYSVAATAGICMDISPYKFTAPFTAYEFATHVLESGAKLVILSMAWLSLLESEQLAEHPLDADMDTSRYWISRFWPLIDREMPDGEEIIVVFANRSGEEEGMEGKDTARYAGTSCVIGFRKASVQNEDYFDVEIVVWDRLGRRQEGVCLVDTESPPKLNLRAVNQNREE